MSDIYSIGIDEKGGYIQKGENKIYLKEDSEYYVEYTEETINNLINWISEATRDKELMKEDLKYLMGLDDEYILSSASTNEYIAESEEEKGYNGEYIFDETCRELLENN